MVNKTKSIIKILLIFIMLILISTSTKAVTTVMFGDVNEDKKIDQKDLNLLSSTQRSKLTERQKIIADLDMNGTVDMADQRLVDRIILGEDTKETIVLLGDVNYDLKVDGQDSRMILRFATSLEKPATQSIKFIADVDQNGKIEPADAQLALRIGTKLDDLRVVKKGYVLKFTGTSREVYKKDSKRKDFDSI